MMSSAFTADFLLGGLAGGNTQDGVQSAEGEQRRPRQGNRRNAQNQGQDAGHRSGSDRYDAGAGDRKTQNFVGCAYVFSHDSLKQDVAGKGPDRPWQYADDSSEYRCGATSPTT